MRKLGYISLFLLLFLTSCKPKNSTVLITIVPGNILSLEKSLTPNELLNKIKKASDKNIDIKVDNKVTVKEIMYLLGLQGKFNFLMEGDIPFTIKPPAPVADLEEPPPVEEPEVEAETAGVTEEPEAVLKKNENVFDVFIQSDRYIVRGMDFDYEELDKAMKPYQEKLKTNPDLKLIIKVSQEAPFSLIQKFVQFNKLKGPVELQLLSPQLSQ